MQTLRFVSLNPFKRKLPTNASKKMEKMHGPLAPGKKAVAKQIKFLSGKKMEAKI